MKRKSSLPLSAEERREKRLGQYYLSQQQIFMCGTCLKPRMGFEFHFNPGSSNGRNLTRCMHCAALGKKIKSDLKKGKRVTDLRGKRTLLAGRRGTKVKEKKQLYMETKDFLFTCIDCEEEKKGSEFFFRATAAADRGHRLQYCKTCYGQRYQDPEPRRRERERRRKKKIEKRKAELHETRLILSKESDDKT